MQPETLSDEVVARLDKLRGMTKNHMDLAAAILGADEGRIFGVDLLMMAAIQRSLSLIDGFCAMVERRNYICAVPLLRMQVDTAMRLFASSLVDDSNTVVMQLLAGSPLRKLKAKNGKLLTDKYLHEELSKLLPWVSRVYCTTSGFVHMSMPHLMSVVQSVGEGDDRSCMFKIGASTENWTEPDMIETLDAFTEATRVVLQIGDDWLITKRRAERRRAEAERPTSKPEKPAEPQAVYVVEGRKDFKRDTIRGDDSDQETRTER